MAFKPITWKTNKIIPFALVVIIVLNLILFSFRRINIKVFWSVIVIVAVYAYFVMPKVKKKI